VVCASGAVIRWRLKRSAADDPWCDISVSY
jgi:hypothetical protein